MDPFPHKIQHNCKTCASRDEQSATIPIQDFQKRVDPMIYIMCDEQYPEKILLNKAVQFRYINLTYQTRYDNMKYVSDLTAGHRAGYILGTMACSNRSKGTILVCIMWLSHTGKNSSSTFGNTNSRSTAQMAQNVEATN